MPFSKARPKLKRPRRPVRRLRKAPLNKPFLMRRSHSRTLKRSSPPKSPSPRILTKRDLFMAGTNGAPITASQIQELREQTGAGIMECKKALEEAHGDQNKAREILRDRGVALAAKKE